MSTGGLKQPEWSPCTYFEQATLMVMQFGQFLDHDITLTPEVLNRSKCCTEEALDGGFPGRCFPIAVPCEDPTFARRHRSPPPPPTKPPPPKDDIWLWGRWGHWGPCRGGMMRRARDCFLQELRNMGSDLRIEYPTVFVVPQVILHYDRAH